MDNIKVFDSRILNNTSPGYIVVLGNFEGRMGLLKNMFGSYFKESVENI